MAHLEHNWTAPQSTTNPTMINCPDSPNALAAAVTLATLSDRPASHGGHEEGVVDHDQGGGISLADYQQFMDAPDPQPMEEEEDTTSVNAQMQALQQAFMSQTYTSSEVHHFETSTST